MDKYGLRLIHALRKQALGGGVIGNGKRKAVKEIGILTGLRIDRREVGTSGEFDRLSVLLPSASWAPIRRSRVLMRQVGGSSNATGTDKEAKAAGGITSGLFSLTMRPA